MAQNVEEPQINHHVALWIALRRRKPCFSSFISHRINEQSTPSYVYCFSGLLTPTTPISKMVSEQFFAWALQDEQLNLTGISQPPTGLLHRNFLSGPLNFKI